MKSLSKVLDTVKNLLGSSASKAENTTKPASVTRDKKNTAPAATAPAKQQAPREKENYITDGFYIGVINYNPQQKTYYLETNGLIKKKPNTMFGFSFDKMLLPSSYSPAHNDFVYFSLTKNNQGHYAAKIIGPLKFNHDCLQTVLRYTGEFEEFHGRNNYVHVCVLRSMLREISAAADGCGFRDTARLALLGQFCRAAVKHGDLSAYWTGLLSGNAAAAVLRELLTEFNHSRLFLNPKLNEAAKVLRSQLNITAGSEALPARESRLSAAYAAADQHIRTHFAKFTAYLKDNPAVLLPGEIGGSAGSLIIYAAACAAGLNLHRAQLWMSWSEALQVLAGWGNQQQIAWFLIAYFRKADLSFVDSHPVQQFITDELAAELQKISNASDDDVLRKVIADRRRIKALYATLEKGQACTVDAQFRQDFNQVFKTKPQLCMNYLQQCAAKGVLPAPAAASGLCDMALLCIFTYSGRPEYLAQLENKDAASDWLLAQDTDFQSSFIKNYVPLIKKLNPALTKALLHRLPEKKMISVLQGMPAGEACQLLRFFPDAYRESLMKNPVLTGSKIFELYANSVLQEICHTPPQQVLNLQPEHWCVFRQVLHKLSAAADVFGFGAAARLALLGQLCWAAVQRGDVSAYWSDLLSGHDDVQAVLRELLTEFKESKLFADFKLNEAAEELRSQLHVEAGDKALEILTKAARKRWECRLSAVYAAADQNIKEHFAQFTAFVKETPVVLLPDEIGVRAESLIIYAAACAAGVAVPRARLQMSWADTLQVLSGWTSRRQIAWFLISYFRRADQNFADNHPIQQFLTDELAAELQKISNDRDDAVLRAAVADRRRIRSFCAALEQGQERQVNEQFRHDFNLVFKTSPQLCMSYLQKCADRGTLPEPEEAKGLCDMALISLFACGGRAEYLALLDDKTAAVDWLLAQNTDFLIGFIKNYAPLLKNTDSAAKDLLLPNLIAKLQTLPGTELNAIFQALPAEAAYMLLRCCPNLSWDSLMKNPALAGSRIFELYARDVLQEICRTQPKTVISLQPEHLCVLRLVLRELSAAADVFGLGEAARLALLGQLCRAAVQHGELSAYWSDLLSGHDDVQAVLRELLTEFNHSKLFFYSKLNEAAEELRSQLNVTAVTEVLPDKESRLSVAYAAADQNIKAHFAQFTAYVKENPVVLLPGEIGGKAGSLIIYAAACAAGVTVPRVQLRMSWAETLQVLSGWSDRRQIAWFLTSYFRKAGKAFAAAFPVQLFLTNKLAAELQKIINEKDDAVLKAALAERKRIRAFCTTLEQGQAGKVNAQFRHDFNLVFNINPQLCLKYLQKCADRGALPAPAEAKGLCDKALISLFACSGRVEYLALLDDKAAAGNWILTQDTGFLIGFIKNYAPLLKNPAPAAKDILLPDQLAEQVIAKLQELPEAEIVPILQKMPAEAGYSLLHYFPPVFRDSLAKNPVLAGSRIFELHAADVWQQIRCTVPEDGLRLQAGQWWMLRHMLQDFSASAKAFGLKEAARLVFLGHLCRAGIKQGNVSAFWSEILSQDGTAALWKVLTAFNHDRLFGDSALNAAVKELRSQLNLKAENTEVAESRLSAAYAAAAPQIKAQFGRFTSYLQQNPEILLPDEIGGSAGAMIIYAAACAAGLPLPQVQLNISWSEVLQELAGWNNPRQIACFLTAYFRQADQHFVDSHPVQQLITADLISELEQLLNARDEDDAALRAVVAEYRRREAFYASLAQGQKLEINEQFRQDFNQTFKTRPQLCINYLKTCADRGTAPEPEAAEGLCDEALLCLFVYSSNPEYLDLTEDLEAAGSWAAEQTSDLLERFVKNYGPLIEEFDLIDTEDNVLPKLPEDKVRAILQRMSADEAYQLLRFFPDSSRESLMENPEMAGSRLLGLYAEDVWRKIRRTLPYCVIDLKIEDHELRECAVCIQDQAIGYQDSSQFKNLSRKLSPGQLYVADNIRPQDLKLFADCIGQELTIHWDTSLMQMLLGLSDRAAARRRAEDIETDVKDIRDLFWKQLYYVSVHQDLRRDLTALLPPVLQDILTVLAKPFFSQIIDQKLGQFFDEVQQLEAPLLTALQQLNDKIQHKNLLIVAPRRLWTALASYVSVSFNDPAGDDYRTLSKEALRQAQPSSLEFVAFRQAALQLPSPVLAALPAYLRLHVIPHLDISQYFEQSPHGSLCADLDIFTKPAELSRFDEICFLGWEIENRIDEHELSHHFTASEVLQYAPGLIMRFGSSCLAQVQRQEISGPWEAELPAYVTNMWLRRLRDGTFKLGYNINVQSRIEQIQKKIKAAPGCSSMVFSTVSWTKPERALGEVFLAVSAAAKGSFDATDLRVGAQSRFRSQYWAWQLKMVMHLQMKSRLPVVYVLDDSDEIEAVADYARSLNFSVCSEGTLQERLDNLSRTSRGLMLIVKTDFPVVSTLKNDHALCYIFDEMAVEKHRLMWWEDPAAQQEAQLDRAGADAAGQEAAADGNYAEIIRELWPEYQSFSAAVGQQNKSSRMYLIEPYLDDFQQLAQDIGARPVELDRLWSSEEEFEAAVQQAEEFFPRTDLKQELQQLDQDKVMQVILNVMVAGPAVKNPVWSPVQQQILPHILAQDNNYMVTIPTGGGKSVLFQGPALFKSSFTGRLSVVITPLKALMQDQVKELQRKGFVTNVDYLNADLPYAQVLNVYRRIRSGEVSLLYIAPERLRSQRFVEALQYRIMQDDGLEYLIFDEAHCISLWGSDFRPEYLRALRECKRILGNKKCCTVLFTATASELILKQIGSELHFKRLGARASDADFRPIREHISFSFKEIPDPATATTADARIEARSRAIVSYIREKKVDFALSRMLVFCQRRRDCEQLASELLPKQLVEQGLLPASRAADYVDFFHAGLEGCEREEIYQRFKAVREEDHPIYILCATKAFGMGMDIPNIHYLMHLNVTPVPEDYLQEVGRAGRNRSMYERAGFSLDHPIDLNFQRFLLCSLKPSNIFC